MTYVSKRADSSVLQFRMRVPQAALHRVKGKPFSLSFPALRGTAACTVTGRIGGFIKFSLRTRDAAVARARDALARSHFELLFEGVEQREHAAEPRVSTIPKGDATLQELFTRWQAENKPAASTVITWRTVLNSFTRHVGHDQPHRITPRDVITWKDALVASSLSSKTIKDTYLAGLRAILNYAVKNEQLAANPAARVTIQVRKRAGERMLPYTDEEVGTILFLADREALPARHWLPWLAALSGARIGELAQLWGERVRVINGIPVMELRPAKDGGSFKNDVSERTVPIHFDIVERGFLEFARERGSGPLFYNRSSASPGRRHASKGVTNHLATWIRNLGFSDPRKALNHAFRHWWKSAAQRAGVQESVADAIQGHAPPSVSRLYRHFDLPLLYEAVKAVRFGESRERLRVIFG